MFYLSGAILALLVVLQLRDATQLKRALAGFLLVAFGAAALYSRSALSLFGVFITAGLAVSLAGTLLLGLSKNKTAQAAGAVTFFTVNIFYFIAFTLNTAEEFAARPFDIPFLAALVVFLDFGGLAFFAGDKRFTLKKLPVLLNILIAAFTASTGVSLGFRYLSGYRLGFVFGLLLVFGSFLFAYANLSVCNTYVKNERFDLNRKVSVFEKLAVPAYYAGQMLIAAGILFVRVPVLNQPDFAIYSVF